MLEVPKLNENCLYITGGLEIVRGSNHLAPSGFTNEEIKFAKSRGVHLKTQYSRTMQDRYVANSCPKCSAFAGDNYLFTQYISPAGYGELPYEEFDIGYHCHNCERISEKNEQHFNEDY